MLSTTTGTIIATPLPKKAIAIVCAILFCESFVSTMIFPYVNAMVSEFNIAKDSEIGYYSGYLASSFFIGQLISSYFWGYLSDKKGRRPILLIGVFGSMVSTTLFGFSPSYFWAISIRSLGGFMNSNWSIARSYIGDITDSTNRVRGFSFVGLMWGAGSIFGPLIGGILSDPKKESPIAFVRHYPFVLPSLLSGLFSLVTWLVAVFMLKESNKAVLQRKENKSVELEDLSGASESLLVNGEDGEKEEKENQDKEEKEEEDISNRSDSKSILLVEEPDGAEKVIPMSPQPAHSLLQTIQNAWKKRVNPTRSKKSSGKYTHIVEVEESDNEQNESNAEESSTNENAEQQTNESNESKQDDPKEAILGKESKQESEEESTSSSIATIFKDRSVVVVILILSFASLCVVTIDELYPLWSQNPPPVGLGFDPKMTGQSWVIGGVTLVVFQGFVYPILTQKVGLITMTRIGCIGFAIDYISFPLLSYLVDNTVLMWIALGGVLFGRYVFGASVGTSLNILVNSVGGDAVKKHRGAVNGVAMTVSGLARAIAPAFGGNVFAWSNSSGNPFPLNHFLVFEIMSVILILMFLLSFLISKHAVQ